MTDLAKAMPLLARQEGVWEGTYRYYDFDGRLVDQHASRLTCRVTRGEDWDYHQTNEYRWADGRLETREFKGRFRDGRLRFEDGPIEGWAAEDPLDPDRLSLLLQWRRRDEPATRFYEMILIDERKVADDWR